MLQLLSPRKFLAADKFPAGTEGKFEIGVRLPSVLILKPEVLAELTYRY